MALAVSHVDSKSLLKISLVLLSTIGYYGSVTGSTELPSTIAPVPPCFSNPCINGGICLNTLDAFTCECPEGITGTTCEIDIDECIVNPCENGGSCENGIGGFSCQCVPDFTNTLCDLPVSPHCSALQNDCTAFRQCINDVTHCGPDSPSSRLLNGLCSLSGDSGFLDVERAATTSIVTCLTNVITQVVDDVFERRRSSNSFDSECQLVDRLVFNATSACINPDPAVFCNIPIITSSFPSRFVGVISEVPLYGDRLQEEMLDFLRECPSNASARAFESPLERFLLCIAVHTSDSSASFAATENLKNFLRTVLNGSDPQNFVAEGEPAFFRCSRTILEGFPTYEFGYDYASDIRFYELIRVTGPEVASAETVCRLHGNNDTDFGGASLVCAACGNGRLEIPEESCDDGNRVDGDGCSATCSIESDFACATPYGVRSACFASACGDGVRVPGEDCDTGGAAIGACETTNCAYIVSGFACPVNAPFNRSVCAFCGDGVREADEECDNGPTLDVDGCANDCTVVPFFECLGERSVCARRNIDFNRNDSSTRDGVVLYDVVGEEVYLVDPDAFDESVFSSGNWSRLVIFSSAPLSDSEAVFVDYPGAIRDGRIVGPDSEKLFGTNESLLFGFGSSTFNTFIEPLSINDGVNLRSILFAIKYRNVASNPGSSPTVISFQVIDSLGGVAPTVQVSVQYVGFNDDPPVFSPVATLNFVEDSPPTAIGQGNLTIVDPDHDSHLMVNATVQLVRSGVISLSLVPAGISVQQNEQSILIEGLAPLSVYESILNNVTYFISGDLFEEQAERLATFTISDGLFVSSTVARINLIDLAKAPVFTPTSGSVFYFEENSAFAAINDGITFSDDGALLNLTASLVGEKGDRLIYDDDIGLLRQERGFEAFVSSFEVGFQSFSTATFAKRSSPSTFLNEVFRQLVFVNVLQSPANVTGTTRNISVSITDETNEIATTFIEVFVFPFDDEPIFHFNTSLGPTSYGTARDRERTVVYFAGGSPVALLPADVVLNDVDSTTTTRFTISLSLDLEGSVLSFQDIDLSTLPLSVDITGSAARFSGEAPLELYRQIALAARYSNDLPVEGLVRAFVYIGDGIGASEVVVRIFTNTSACVELPCIELPAPSNGARIGGNSSCRSTAFFSCDHCYSIASGSATRTCLPETGLYTGNQPTCELDTCPPLVAPENGRISGDNFDCDSIVEFSCDPCYGLTGSSFLQCEPGGVWSNVPPTCELLDCFEYFPPPNGFVIGNDTTCGSAVEIRCNPGHLLIGDPFSICTASESFSFWCNAEVVCSAVVNLTIFVRDAVTGDLISDPEIAITSRNSFSTFSSPNTYLEPTLVPSGVVVVVVPADDDRRLFVHATAQPDYAPTTVSYAPISGGGQFLDVYLRRFSISHPFDESPVFDFETNDGVRVDLGRDVDSLQVVTGVDVSTFLGGIPSLATRISLPGADFPTYVNLEIVATAVVGLFDANATSLSALLRSDLKEKRHENFTAIKIPLDDSLLLNHNDMIEVWCYDFFAGNWRSNGFGIVDRGYNDSLFLTFPEIDAFTWWIAARRIENETCASLSASFRDGDGALTPLRFALVSVDGFVDFEHSSVMTTRTTTDSTGEACFQIPLGAHAHAHVDLRSVGIDVEIPFEFTGFETTTLQCPDRAFVAIDRGGVDVRDRRDAYACQELSLLVVDCGNPIAPIGGSVTELETLSVFGVRESNGTVDFECDFGRNLVGSSAGTCLSNGSWSVASPECVLVDCGELVAPANGDRIGDLTTFDSVVEFQCDVGYELVGSSQRRCQVNGTWTGTETTCRLVNCGDLQRPNNGSRLGETTTFESTIRFECDTGFEVIGQAIAVCQANGNWSSITPTCEVVDCPGLPIPKNGTKSGSSDSSFGVTIEFACNECYRLVNGSVSRTCQPNGTWSGFQPECEFVTCEDLPVPVNGLRIGDDDSTCSSVARFSCNEGYVLTGSRYRLCQENGTWSGTEPQCSPVDCGDLDSPLNGEKLGNETTFNSTMDFFCDNCYLLEGSSKRTCLSNGSWSGDTTTCRLIHCDELQSLTNGRRSSNATFCGSTISFECDFGYDLVGSASRTCLTNGTWSGSETLCRAIDCGSLPVPPNGQKQTIGGTRLGGRTLFTCDDCYVLVGSSERTCLADGTWSGSDDVACTLVLCDGLPFPANGRRVGTNWTCSASVEFGCDDGYVLFGSSRRTCTIDGTWSGDEATCNAVDCGVLDAPSRGSVSFRTTTFGSVTSFSCASCCELSGEVNSTCLFNGQWSDAEPICQEVDACRSSPCLNGGTCVDTFRGFDCYCPLNFIGKRCEIASPFGVCGVEQCDAFLSKAVASFECGPDSYLETFATRLCSISSARNLTFRALHWSRTAWRCLVRTTVSVVDSIYGSRTETPFSFECLKVDRLLYAAHSACLAADLCATQFAASDAEVVVDLLHGLTSYRDRAVAQMLELARSCNGTETTAELRGRLESDGFVLCLVVTAVNESDVLDVTAQFQQLLRETKGIETVVVLDETGQCSLAAGRRKREALDEFAVALLSNGTNATNSETICDGSVNGTAVPGVELVCPVCGDARLEIPSEECDDGNVVDGDGCTSACEIEAGFSCSVEVDARSVCANRTCGDGVRVLGEECDTGGGPGCDPINCTIVIECAVNPPLGRSECTLCGNGVVDDGEACDNGPSEIIDGCSDACTVDVAFDCGVARVGETSVCEHVEIDFSVADNTTLNNEVIYAVGDDVVFLGEPGNVDGSEYGNEDWRNVTAEYFGFEDNIDIEDPSFLFAATQAALVRIPDFVNLLREVNAETTRTTMSFVRLPGREANLTVLLQALSFRHNNVTASFKDRFALVTVYDNNGLSSTPVNISLRYVGENAHPPNLRIDKNVVVFVEGRTSPILITQNSLTLNDSDNDFYQIESAVVRFVTPKSSDEFLSITTSSLRSLRISVADNGSELRINGNGGTDDYAALLNNITYFNSRSQFSFVSPNTVISFSVFDGVFATTANLTVRLRAVNALPVLLANGSPSPVRATYHETNRSAIILGRVQVFDVDHTVFQSASIWLRNPLPGDEIGALNFAAGFLRTDATNFTLVGPGNASDFEFSVTFVNLLPAPANLSSTDRHIEVVIRDEFNASRPFLFIVSVVPFNDPPQIVFDVTNVTYTINAPPIVLFPSDVDLVDVDTATLSEIRISFEESRFGDVINAGDFESVGIATERLDDGSQRLTGISTTANYLLALKSLTYSTSIALSGYSIVDVTATDSDGAVSDAARIFIQTNTTGCFPLSCDLLPDLVNGAVDGGESTCSATAFFSCSPCFELVGPSNATCSESGNWTTFPSCRQKFCERLLPPRNGRVNESGLECGSSTTYVCDSCYELVGNSTRTCLPDGAWSGAEPTCELLSCGFLPVPINAVQSGNGTLCEDVVQYSCEAGFALVGSPSRICFPDASWCGNAPVCQGVANLTITPIDFDTEAPLVVDRIRLFTLEKENSTTELYRDLTHLTNLVIIVSVPLGRRYIVVVEKSEYSTSSKSLFIEHNSQRNNVSIIVRRQSVLDGVASPSGNVSFTTETLRRLVFVPASLPSSVVTARVTTVSSSLEGVPQLYGRLVDGRSVYLDLLAAVDVDVFVNDSRGQLHFDLEIDCDSFHDSPSVFRYNSTSGFWRQVDDRAIVSSACVWSYDAADSGWWAIAFAWRERSCFVVSATTANASGIVGPPTTGVVAKVNGVDFGFSALEAFDDEGTVCVEVRLGREATMEFIDNGGSVRLPIVASNVSSSCSGKNRWVSRENSVGNCTIEDVLVVTCEPLFDPLNGRRLGDARTSLMSSTSTILAVTEFLCDPGHVLVGSRVRTCLLNGSWNGTQPTCKLVDCGPLANISNGIAVFQATTVGFTAEIICDEGYRLNGLSTRECQEDGTYNGTEPTCLIADCGSLPAPKNGFALGNETVFGSEINFDCDIGYEIKGPSRRICQANGLWSGDQPSCGSISCDGLPAPRFGAKFGKKDGLILDFDCDACYRLNGSESRRCIGGAKWTGTDTQCLLVDCGPLLPPSNGTISLNDTTCPSEAYFACLPGHLLLGSPNRTCLSSGLWSGNKTSCEFIDCGPLPPPSNGRLYGNSTFLDAVIDFECDVCYRLDGPQWRVCNESGVWSGVQPSCNIIDCGSPESGIENGGFVFNATTCGSSIRFFCDDGYVLRGSDERTCLPDGNWNGTEPTCAVVICESLPVPLNGQKIDDDPLFGNVTHFVCDSCFRLVGSADRQCLSNGQYSGVQPICEPVGCDELPHPLNGTRLGRNRSCESSVEFACDSGYLLLGSSRRTCQLNQTWSGDDTVCEPVDCGDLPIPRLGRRDGNATTFGSVMTFRCDPCCEIIGGAEQRICQENGTWSGEQPTCTAIDACRQNPCLNGGTCRDEAVGFTCFCPGNFEGEKCEIPLSAGVCRMPECLRFISLAEKGFECSSSYVSTFLKPFCLMSVNASVQPDVIRWARRVWPCLVANVVQEIETTYGNRFSRPTVSECQAVDRRNFATHSCFVDRLCETPFTRADALVIADVLSASPFYRDRNVEELLRVLALCPSSSSPAHTLQSVLREEGYVICVALPPSQNSSAAIVASVRAALSADVSEIDDTSACEATAQRRRRRNVVPNIVALRVNGTNATSAERLCDADNGTVVDIICPSCGDGVFEMPSEACDDGNVVDGDGCSSSCEIEGEFDCDTTPLATSVCYNRTCGDGIRVAGEDCDTGDNGDEIACIESNCQIVANSFACSINEPYETSSCSTLLCGNGVVDINEECDNGLSAVPDGCDDDACRVSASYECFGAIGDVGTCRRSGIDFASSTDETRNGSIVYFRADDVVFFVAPTQLDASSFNDTNWLVVAATLSGENDRLRERLDLSLDAAVLQGRLNVTERNLVATRTLKQAIFVSNGDDQLIVRRVSSTDSLSLRLVLLALSYTHSGSPDDSPRLVSIVVTDVYDVESVPSSISLRFVGINENAPVLVVSNSTVRFVEGSLSSVSVSQGSLRLSDADNDFYPIKSALVRIVDKRFGERLGVSMNSSNELASNVSDDSILFYGDASVEVYEEALNRVTYFNQNPQISSLHPSTVLFEVFDGQFTSSASVTVELHGPNSRPSVTFNGELISSINFTEGGPPVGVPLPVAVSDPDHETLTSGLVSLLNGEPGDRLTVNTSFSSGAVTVENNGFLSVVIRGRASLGYYSQILSSIQFSNSLLNITSSPRLIRVTVQDGANASIPAQIEIHVTSRNDRPLLQTSTPNVTFIDDGTPVRLFDSSSTRLDDVDSDVASRATVTIVRQRNGDTLQIDVSLAHSLGINATISSSLLILSGSAPMDDYLQVLFTVRYLNIRRDLTGSRTSIVSVTVVDSTGAVSDPLSIRLTALADGPRLDFGVGVGVPDSVVFVEDRPTGIHVVSLPHRVRIVDPNGDGVKECTVTLKADDPDMLDDNEYVYTFHRPPLGLELLFDSLGKSLTLRGAAPLHVYEEALERIFYVNTADEPRIFDSRKIIVELTPNVSSSESLVAGTIHVTIKTVNDHAPTFSFGPSSSPPSCVSPFRVASRSRREQKEISTQLLKSRVRVIELVLESKEGAGKFGAGSMLYVRFFDATKEPRLMGRRRLDRALAVVSPAEIGRLETIAEWLDDRTLAVVFPRVESEIAVRGSVVVKFYEDGYVTKACKRGICDEIAAASTLS